MYRSETTEPHPVARVLRAEARVLVRMRTQHTQLLYRGLLTAFNCIKLHLTSFGTE